MNEAGGVSPAMACEIDDSGALLVPAYGQSVRFA